MRESAALITHYKLRPAKLDGACEDPQHALHLPPPASEPRRITAHAPFGDHLTQLTTP